MYTPVKVEKFDACQFLIHENNPRRYTRRCDMSSSKSEPQNRSVISMTYDDDSGVLFAVNLFKKQYFVRS